MSVIIGFLIVLMVMFLVYMAYRLILRRKPVILISFALQIAATTVAVLSFSGNVQSTGIIDAGYITFGIAIPAVFLVYDYIRMVRKVRERGVYEGFIEAIPREDEDEADTDAAKRLFNPLIKEWQANDVVSDIHLNADDIMKNLKKILVQAGVYLSRKDLVSAYETYNNLIKMINHCPGLYFNHGNICYHKGDYAQAVQSFKKALELIDKRDAGRGREGEGEGQGILVTAGFQIRYNLGNAYFRLEKYEQALNEYKKALDINPGLKEASENIVWTLCAMNKPNDALEYYKKTSGEGVGNCRMHYVAGQIYKALGKLDEAAAELAECVKLDPTFTDAYSELGSIRMKAGKYDEASEIFRKVISQKPQDYRGYYNLAMAYYRSDMKDEAVACFKNAVKIAPDCYRGYYNMAVVLDEMGRQEEAVSAFRKVIDLKGDFIDAYNNLGILLSTQSKHKEALEVYIQGLKQNPDEYSLFYNMGITLSEMGRYGEAVEAFENALDIKPDECEIYYHMGAALMEQKRYNEAIEAYKCVLKVKPSDSELYYNLAAMYSLLRKHDIALDNLKRAIELNGELKREVRLNRAFDGMRGRQEFRQLIS